MENSELLNTEKNISMAIFNENQDEIKNIINININFFEFETNFNIRAYKGIKLEEIKKTLLNYYACNGIENLKIIFYDKYGKDLRLDSHIILPQTNILCFSLESDSKYSPVFVRIAFENYIKHLVLGLKYDESIAIVKILISNELNIDSKEIDLCSSEEKLDSSKLLSDYFLKNSGYLICYRKSISNWIDSNDSYYIVDVKGGIYQFDKSIKLSDIITNMYQDIPNVYRLKECIKIENISNYEVLQNDLIFISPNKGDNDNTCVTINLIFPSAKSYSLKLSSDCSFEEVKKIIEFTQAVPYYLQILIFNSKELEDSRRIIDYNIHDNSLINVLYKFK